MQTKRGTVWGWAVASAALHAGLIIACMARPPKLWAATEPRSVWMEAVVQAPPSRAPRPEPTPVPVPEKVTKTPPKAPRAKAVRVSVTGAAHSGAPSGATLGVANTGDNTLHSLTGSGTLAVGVGPAAGSGNGAGTSAGDTGAPAVPRIVGPARMSVWMDTQALVRMALVRPGTAFLSAVPGYRDVLRGSGIDPFSDLSSLRISLGELSQAQLLVAGHHAKGEDALRQAAQRVASMRNAVPIWRGDADLRATSWVDGTGVDRGFAVHGGAFVIAARTALPALLGTSAPGQQVSSMSSMREHVVLSLTIEAGRRYLPALRDCVPQALRVAIAAEGGRYRLAMTASYETVTLAQHANTCLRALPTSANQLTNLVAWLARAESNPNSLTTSLRTEAANADIEQLLSELAWVLRAR